jgi:multidrug efflux pump subunit AcrA (membrane-fusion protein)
LFEIRLDPPVELGWKAGQAVRVAVPVSDRREVLAVPADALILRREGVSVFRIDGDGVAERIEVVLGAADGTMIEVTGNLEAGDRVVIRGGERLRPGQQVTVLD